jgi:hypothetical protein
MEALARLVSVFTGVLVFMTLFLLVAGFFALIFWAPFFTVTTHPMMFFVGAGSFTGACYIADATYTAVYLYNYKG